MPAPRPNSGAYNVGTTSTSALQRCGCRNANCTAEGDPADMPTIGIASMRSTSSSAANASACAAGEASAGRGVRR
jgi:hypothetical protein